MDCVAYILFSEKLNKFYIGSCQIEFEVRLQQHLDKFFDTAFTKIADDWKVFLLIPCESIKVALRIEKHIKRMKSRTYIENLKKHPDIVARLKMLYK